MQNLTFTLPKWQLTQYETIQCRTSNNCIETWSKAKT